MDLLLSLIAGAIAAATLADISRRWTQGPVISAVAGVAGGLAGWWILGLAGPLGLADGEVTLSGFLQQVGAGALSGGLALIATTRLRRLTGI